MSLDVSLKVQVPIKKIGTGVFIRDSGGNRELTLDEVKTKYPDYDAAEFLYESDEVFEYNITHNLTKMADEAGIYEHLWRPEEIGITTAIQLIDPLREGLHRLKSDPKKYEEFAPENKWGSYEGLVKFVEAYLDACYRYPDATIEVSR